MILLPSVFLIFYARLNIFITEVLEHSDLLDSNLFMASTWLQDPPNLGGPKITDPENLSVPTLHL